MHRMTITFVSTDSPRPREVFKFNFYVLEFAQNFLTLHKIQLWCSRKYNFLHVIYNELLQNLAKIRVKEEKSQPSYICDNSI